MEEELLFRIMFIGLYGVFAVIRIYFRSQTRGRDSKEEKTMMDKPTIFLSLVILIFLAATIIYLLVPDWIFWAHFDYPIEIRWVGLVLGSISSALLVVTHVTLGRQYSAKLEIQQEHKLIQIGLYSRVRHPMYTVFISFSIAVALVSSNWFLIISSILIGVGLYWISHSEEKMLIEEFGNEYLEYKNRTGRFFPRVRGKD
ncbi:MAG: isoprenylcysteine carboxylmethyltransferase family protein [Candidatus Thorarchaeota archaeon]|jgi:protein-S-isoprenylcysteine O-methyltransferase Ste14